MKKIIVIDGLDGSGKNTQAKMLVDRLNMESVRSKLVSFPVYESKSSELIKMYLNGEIDKDVNKVNAYAATIFYTADRYIQFKRELDRLDDDIILVCDRYTSANIIHQGSKFNSDKKKQEEYYEWCKDLEYNRVWIPKEIKTIILLVEPEISQRLMSSRGSSDIHEGNIKYLRECYEGAKRAAEYNGWDIINCTDGINIHSKEYIHEIIYNKVRELV